MAGDTATPKPAAPAAPPPLLELDTLIERRRIAIDGELYEIISPDELSVIDSHRFGRWGRRIEQLAEMDGEEAERELEELIAITARKILVGVPDQLFEQLPGSGRWAVIDLFTGLLLQRKLLVAGAMQAAMGMEAPTGMGPTGVPPLPGSSGSMAGTRKTGWLPSLQRFFGRTSA